MIEPSKFYLPSGKFAAAAPVMILLIGGLGGAILAAIYALAIFYIPFIYINFFLTLGLGFGVGVLVDRAGRIGNSRSFKLNTALGFLLGLVALYFHWVVWIYALSGWTALAVHPGDPFSIITSLTIEGVWEIFGGTPSGILLWLIWGIEALIIVGLPTLIAGNSTDDVFCEKCGIWAADSDLVTREIPENLVSILEEMAEGKIDTFLTLAAAGPSEGAFLKSVHSACPRCEQLHTLSVSTVVVGHGDKGEEESEENEVIPKLLISAQDAQSLSEANSSALGSGS